MQAKLLRGEVARLEELLKETLQERKRGEIKAKQASERQRNKEAAKKEREKAEVLLAGQAPAPYPQVATSAATPVATGDAAAAAPPPPPPPPPAAEEPEEVRLNPHALLPEIEAGAPGGSPAKPAPIALGGASPRPAPLGEATPASKRSLGSPGREEAYDDDDFDDDFEEDVDEEDD